MFWKVHHFPQSSMACLEVWCFHKRELISKCRSTRICGTISVQHNRDVTSPPLLNFLSINLLKFFHWLGLFFCFMFEYYAYLHFERAKTNVLIFLLIHKMGHEQWYLVSRLQVTWGFLAGWGKCSDPMHNFILLDNWKLLRSYLYRI